MSDYNNSRIMDFQTVEKFTSNALAIQDAARMRKFLPIEPRVSLTYKLGTTLH
jgi:hypothetical protein